MPSPPPSRRLPLLRRRRLLLPQRLPQHQRLHQHRPSPATPTRESSKHLCRPTQLPFRAATSMLRATILMLASSPMFPGRPMHCPRGRYSEFAWRRMSTPGLVPRTCLSRERSPRTSCATVKSLSPKVPSCAAGSCTRPPATVLMEAQSSTSVPTNLFCLTALATICTLKSSIRSGLTPKPRAKETLSPTSTANELSLNSPSGLAAERSSVQRLEAESG